MIYKEQNILFPNCAVNFTEDEWIGIYHDSKDYAVCFGVENEIWDKAENKSTKAANKSEYSKEEIVMPGGHMTIEQLTALLNTIPLEISFIDDNNINRFLMRDQKYLNVRAWQLTGKCSHAIHLKSSQWYVQLLKILEITKETVFRCGRKKAVVQC